MDAEKLRMTEIPQKGWEDIKQRTAKAAAESKKIWVLLDGITTMIESETEEDRHSVGLRAILDMLEDQHKYLAELFMIEAYIQTMDS